MCYLALDVTQTTNYRYLTYQKEFAVKVYIARKVLKKKINISLKNPDIYCSFFEIHISLVINLDKITRE